MSNEFVEQFKLRCKKNPLRTALQSTIAEYIDSRENWLDSCGCLGIHFFSRKTTQKNLNIMSKVLSILISETNEDMLVQEISLLKEKLSKSGKGRQLLEVYLHTVYNTTADNCCVCGKKIYSFGFRWRKNGQKQHHCRMCGLPVCDSCSQHTIHSDYIERTAFKSSDGQYVRTCDNCFEVVHESHPVLKKFMRKIYPQYDIFILGHRHVKYSHAGTSFLYNLLKFYNFKNTVIHLESYFGDKYSEVKGPLNYTDLDVASSKFLNNLSKYDYSSSTDNSSRQKIASNLTAFMSNETTSLHDKYWEIIGHPEYKKLGELCRNEKHQIPIYTFDDPLSVIDYKKTSDDIAKEQERHFWNTATDGVRNALLMRDRANRVIADRIKRIMKKHPHSKAFIVIGEAHLYDTNAGQYALQRFFPRGRCAALAIREGKSSFDKFELSDSLESTALYKFYPTCHPDYTIGWPNMHKNIF